VDTPFRGNVYVAFDHAAAHPRTPMTLPAAADPCEVQRLEAT
jgi:hypothetical protein